MASKNMDVVGGFTNLFVEEVPDNLICPICFLPLRDPQLLDCCGVKICESCITVVKNQNKPCPHCQEQNYITMLDKQMSREILSLKVYCELKDDGCDWTGELRDADTHKNEKCVFKEVSCPYNCGVCYTLTKLEKHEEECPNQPLEVKIEVFHRKMLCRVDELEAKQIQTENRCRELEAQLHLKNEEIKDLKLYLQISDEDKNILKVYSGGWFSGCKATITFNSKPLLHRGDYANNTGRGLNVVVLDKTSYVVLDQGTFDTNGSKNASTEFVDFLDKFPNGSVVAIAICDEAKNYLFTDAKKVIKSLGGYLIDDVGYRHSYSLIAIKGNANCSLESTGRLHAPSIASYRLPVGGTENIEKNTVIKVMSPSYCSEMHTQVVAFSNGQKYNAIIPKIKDRIPPAEMTCFGSVDLSNKFVSLKYYDPGKECYWMMGTIDNEITSHYNVLAGRSSTSLHKSIYGILETLGSKLCDKISTGNSWVYIRGKNPNEESHPTAQISVATTD